MFLNHSKPEEFKIDGNWFSILNINMKKRTVGQLQVIYDPIAAKWNEVKCPLKKLNKWYDSKLTGERRDHIVSKLKNQLGSTSFIGRVIEEEVTEENNHFFNTDRTSLTVVVKNKIKLVDIKSLKSLLIHEQNIDIVNFIL